MTSIPPLTKSDILRWTSDVYFQRGQKYFDKGAIYDQRRQGMTLRSKCSGSQAPFYRQEVEFDSKGIKAADCSCPVGGGGYCKHAVALLLTWVNDSDSFQEVESFDAALEKRSKAELIVLIKQMLEQEPDLESLLDLHLLAKDTKQLDVKAVRRQAQQAFRGVDHYEWGYTRDIKKALNPLINLASNYLAHNNPSNASKIYEAVIETILDEEHITLDDEEGVLLRVMYDCCEALGTCLESIIDSKERRGILQVLFSAYCWDVSTVGGVGTADCVPEIFVSKTSADERAEIAGWTREILPQGSSWSNGYHREALGGLILDLEADILDDEAYLKICRETGQLNNLFERLLQLKRVDEAKDAVRDAKDFDILIALNIFENQGLTDIAVKLVEERLIKIEDGRLLEWLSERYQEKGNFAGALALEEKLFRERPSLEKHEQLFTLAEQIDRGDAVRKKMITWLENEGNFYLLVEIYLFEKDVKNALLALERVRAHWGIEDLRFTVARAAKEIYPQEAIRILTEDAENFIGRRGRDNYAQAAWRLHEVRDIYRQSKDTQTWDKFIADIRKRHKRLPALQDELNQLKL